MIFKRVSKTENDIQAPPAQGPESRSSRDVKNSMSNTRFLGTFASLFLGLVLIYSSIFYVPAFLDVQKVMGVSTETVKLPRPETQSSKLETYVNLFKVRRGYLRRGQALTLEYDLSPGMTMTASISRCSAPPVIEVFYCRNIEGEHIKINGDIPGKRNFIMRKPGFYYFDEVITQKKGFNHDDAYQVFWSRRSGQPA